MTSLDQRMRRSRIGSWSAILAIVIGIGLSPGIA
jgi:hypothetical protein